MLLSELDVKNGRCVTKDSEGDHWVTIKKDPDGHGRKILLDKNGKIIGGDVPKHFQGKHIGSVGKKEVKQKETKKEVKQKETKKEESNTLTSKSEVVKNQKTRAHAEGDSLKGPREEIEFIAKELDVGLEKASDMRRAINYWSSHEFQKMRKAMSDPGNPKNYQFLYEKKQILELISYFEEYLEKAPKWDGNGELFRGIGLKKSEIKRLKVGGVIDMKGASSWSSSKKIAVGFAEEFDDKLMGFEQVVLKMEKSDTGTSIKHLSRSKEECEVVCPKSTKFKVEKVEKVKDIFYVSVKEEV